MFIKILMTAWKAWTLIICIVFEVCVCSWPSYSLWSIQKHNMPYQRSLYRVVTCHITKKNPTLHQPLFSESIESDPVLLTSSTSVRSCMTVVIPPEFLPEKGSNRCLSRQFTDLYTWWSTDITHLLSDFSTGHVWNFCKHKYTFI